MSYYVLLLAASVIIAWLTWRIWRKTHEMSFVIGLCLIYYWSLYGAWSIVADGTGGTTPRRYHYLYDKLFTIELDHYYFLTILLYAVFVIGIALTVLRVARDPATMTRPGEPLTISHTLVIGMCAAAGLLSYTIVREAIQSSTELGLSAYATTRGGDVGPLFTLHQVLNRMALLPAALGLAVIASGKGAKCIAGRSYSLHVAGYAAVLAGMYAFCVVLGNKNELFASLLAGVLFYFANTRSPRYWLVAGSGALGLALIGAIDWLRAMPTGGVWDQLNWQDFQTSLIEIGSSNEAFGSHFSLYGVLRFQVPLTYGDSLISLATSVVPRVFWPDRPLDIYPYYAESVQAVGGQGYSLHHAAGWYLNFGVAGVVIGAVVWGWLWASMFNRFHRLRSTNTVIRFFTILAPWVFVAGIPSLIRTGIEGYKGLAVDSFLVPTLSLALTHMAVASLNRVARPARRRRTYAIRAARVAPRLTET
jgi:hypothetical protein